MDQWTPDEVDAHVQFMRDFAARLEETGEFVDTQALAPDGAFVRYDGEGRPPVTDGPFVETKDLIAGWYIIDVESWDRAVQLAGELSAAPGPGGKPIYEWLEVRPFLARLAHGHRVNEPLLRDLVPAVIGVLVRRGADFAAAEDAVQDALVVAVRVWPENPPRDPKGWLITVARRKFLDAARADTSRRHREVRVEGEPMPGRGTALRRSRPISAQPPRTRPPHATGRTAQRAATQLSGGRQAFTAREAETISLVPSRSGD